LALPPSKHELLRSVSAEILEAQRPLRVLRALVWTDEAERAFLQREGAVTEPRYVPAWARDLSYLTAFMSYSAFLGECDLSAERRRYEDLISRADDEEL
jgi:hypothetical protein